MPQNVLDCSICLLLPLFAGIDNPVFQLSIGKMPIFNAVEPIIWKYSVRQRDIIELTHMDFFEVLGRE
jgi:hypothetical protein